MQFLNAKTTIISIEKELAAYKEAAQIMDHFLSIASERINEQKRSIADLQHELAAAYAASEVAL